MVKNPPIIIEQDEYEHTPHDSTLVGGKKTSGDTISTPPLSEDAQEEEWLNFKNLILCY